MTSADVAVQPDQQQPGLSLVPTAPEQITAALEQWVGGMAASVRGAEYLVDTPMCPDSFWPLPPNVTKSNTPKQPIGNEDRDSYLARRRTATYTLGSVVRYGLQLGLPPEVAVQGIFVVGGRMSMYAEQMVALVKSRGHGHRVIERTRTRCIVEVWRAGETDREQFEFTIEDAIAAGYVPDQGPNAKNHGSWKDGTPKKSPGNAKYLTDPAAMLYARATSIACRTKFPDVLRGLTSYEDLQDERAAAPVDITAEVEVSRPAAPRATAAEILAAGEQQPVEPESEPVTSGVHEMPADATPAPAPVERAVLPITDPQLRMLGAVMAQLGVTGTGSRERRLAIASRIVDRRLESSKDLTKDEASTVIDTLTSVLHDPNRVNRLRALEYGRPAPAADGDELVGDADPDTDGGWPEVAQPGQDGDA